MKDDTPTYPNRDDADRPEWAKTLCPLFSAAEDVDGERARPSSLVAVHRPKMTDPLHELNLLRMMQVANERTVRELGPLPLAGLPEQKRRKPTAPYTDFLGRVVPDVQPIVEENDEMKLRQAAAAAVLTAAVALVACEANHDGTAATAIAGAAKPNPDPIPTPLASSSARGSLQAEISSAKTNDSSAQAELQPFIEPGMQVRAVARGDINNDGLPDVVMMLESLGDTEKPRSVLLLVRDRSGLLHRAAQNDKVVPCAGCGGMFGDPFAYVSVENGLITIVNEGGSRIYWSNKYVFKYTRDGWLLDKLTRKVVERATSKSKTVELTEKDFGAISFEAVDPKKFPAIDLP